MNVAIIGCGLIGNKRAQYLKGGNLLYCVDIKIQKAQALANKNPGCQVLLSWQEVMIKPEIDIVIVATTHEVLTEISLAAIEAGKNVLIEKPGARFSKELEPVIKKMKKSNVIVKVGFNHRYHKALLKAYEIYQRGELGELMFIRARYGHGGRIGYDKEWRSIPELSGGGELLDKGIHLVDLSRWFLGDFTEISGFAHTYYWDRPVDDNGFILLKTATKQTAFLHASCTEWKNLFSFEIYGKKGKLDIQGLGGSYGIERLSYYKMLPHMGPPETSMWEYPMGDDSWQLEFSALLDDIKNRRSTNLGLQDAHAALTIVEKVAQGSGYAYHT
ncbi:Gfo/Idh/MocA family oxidoreductase [Rickettsiella endosymbiont of Miltochrista miniata]|uniref:Gfo/Idh/MocA family protein n=1 Tax=Rickettsiella endosymbiont of Miltochrista miniata TaxID=3066239 RepID=UPI00313D8064